MIRLLELIGLLAPIAGGIMLFLYRKRSASAFAWGAAGCAAALVASGIALLARWQMVAEIGTGSAWPQALEDVEGWALLRFGLLLIAGALIVIGAATGRDGNVPVGWLAAGLVLMAAGTAAHFMTIDLGSDHEGLTAMAGVLLETAEFGFLGLGIVLLCIAAATGRSGADGRSDPADLARRAGSTAWRMYAETRRRNER